MSVNKFIGIGNVTKDPEVRYMTNGEAVANFSIACNEKWKTKDGEKKESVEFINLVAYRKLAEIIAEYVRKGSQIYVEGKLQTRKWQTKEGQDRYTTEIIVDQMQMLGGKSNSEVADKPAQSRPASAKGGGFDNFDSDIQF